MQTLLLLLQVVTNGAVNGVAHVWNVSEKMVIIKKGRR